MMNLSNQTAQTVETAYIQSGDIRFAYRKVGEHAGVPLVLLSRFRGTLDDWDPALINGLAQERTVVYFDNVGVGLTTGEAPTSMSGVAKYAADFIDAMGFEQVDLLGWGGHVAQQLTLDRPNLVRRLILAGTGPGGGEGTERSQSEVFQVVAKPVNVPEDFLYLFFEPTQTSQTAGRRYLERLQERQGERSPLVKPETVEAQIKALLEWERVSSFERLGEIKQPVLVVNGNHDIVTPTINSYILSQQIPNAHLILYPDSGHGFLFQHVEAFVEHVRLFLQ